MVFKKSIHRKMMLYLLGASLIVYIVSLGYVGLEVKGISKENAKTYLAQKSNDKSNMVRGIVDRKAKIAESLAFTIKNGASVADQNTFFTEALKEVIKNDNSIISAWLNIESDNSEGSGDEFGPFDDSFGFFSDEESSEDAGGATLEDCYISLYRENGEIEKDENAGIPEIVAPYYETLRESMLTVIARPYKQKSVFDDSVLVTSIMAPIIVDGDVKGAVSISFPLDCLHEALQSEDNDAQVYLISDDSSFIYNPNRSMLGKRQAIVSKEVLACAYDTVLTGVNENNKPSLIVCNNVEAIDSHWHLVTMLPVKVAYLDANKSFFNVIALIAIGFILILIVISFVANGISKSIVNINNKLADLSLGIIDKMDNNRTLTENEMTDLSGSLGNLFDSLQASVDFAGEIGKGNLDAEYKLLSSGDTLGTSLITMQKSLVKAKAEEDKKKLLDDQRNWVTHGLANFGEIIRQENDNVEDFAFNLLSQLLKYVDVVQGAIYFKVEDEYDPMLKFDNKAAIAYGKQVMLETPQINEQDGLFGRVITEQKCIYLENVPNNYVHFTPGKKDAQRPRNLLVVPMVVNDEIFGVMELMSYNSLEKYKIEFVEKLCENIASVISSVNTNIHNANLLEQSNVQAEELSQHEEEMRQNLEEMQATQEEATKRFETLNSQISAFYNGFMVAEIDLDGKVISMSKNMTSFYGISNDSVQGSSYIAVVAQDESASDSYKDFWTQLLLDGKAQRKQVTLIRGKELETQEYYKLVCKDAEPYRVVVVAINRTRENELQERLMIEMQSYMQEHGMATGN